MSTPCPAPPGSFCSPLDRAVFLCPESYYCPGGAFPARACPPGTWSAVGSAFLDDCQDHAYLTMAIALALLLAFFAVAICCFYAPYDFDPRYPLYTQPIPQTHRTYKYVYHTAPTHPTAPPGLAGVC